MGAHILGFFNSHITDCIVHSVNLRADCLCVFVCRTVRLCVGVCVTRCWPVLVILGVGYQAPLDIDSCEIVQKCVRTTHKADVLDDDQFMNTMAYHTVYKYKRLESLLSCLAAAYQHHIIANSH